MGTKITTSSGDKELAALYKKMNNEIRAAETIVSGLKPTGRKNPSDYQKAMKFVQDKDLTSKNVPGGILKRKRGGKL